MKVNFSRNAEKQFLKLDNTIQKQITKFVYKLIKSEDPRSMGKNLVGNLLGFWRYRVGDYRLICRIIDDELEILVVEIGHRKEIYK